MPFEPGNQLAAKRRIFEGAIKRALAQDNADRLRRACERLLDSAADGATWAERIAALQFLADRLDGRVIPQLPDQGDGTLVVSWVMHSAQSAPITIDNASQGAIENHSAPVGTIAAPQAEPAPHAEIAADGGVGGGGGTPTRTSGTPPHTFHAPSGSTSE